MDQMFQQTIQINLPPQLMPSGALPSGGGSVSQVEQALNERKPVPLYGIYFDFNGATVKAESEFMLAEIALIAQRHPDWRLALSEYTDGIGTEKVNLALSQRRAAAVKNVLVTRFKIAPDRLETDGYGAARPIDANDSLDGRARNRRLELRRL
jgi:OOP family OmpA-OmpF porin